MRITSVLKGTAALGFAAALATGGPAWGQGPPAPPDLVKASLVPETAAAASGATGWADLHLEAKPGWHIYWRNPGDSGLPTAIDRSLPPGFSVGHILWPLPEHFVQNGIGNYGYAGATDLLVPITAPRELAVGHPASLEAN